MDVSEADTVRYPLLYVARSEAPGRDPQRPRTAIMPDVEVTAHPMGILAIRYNL